MAIRGRMYHCRYQVKRYLSGQPCQAQSKDVIQDYLTKIRPFKLTKYDPPCDASARAFLLIAFIYLGGWEGGRGR